MVPGKGQLIEKNYLYRMLHWPLAIDRFGNTLIYFTAILAS
jgi:hypothetical protein